MTQTRKVVNENGYEIEMFILEDHGNPTRNHVHREDGPAIIVRKDGSIVSKRWYDNGVRHRGVGPAEMTFAVIDGHAISLSVTYNWYYHGTLHRVGGPAHIHEIFSDNDHLLIHEWYEDGVRHRTDGPAYQAFRHGMLISESWALDGKTFDDFYEFNFQCMMRTPEMSIDGNHSL